MAKAEGDTSTGRAAAREELASVVAAELAKCAKCGSCAAVCPVYAEKNAEQYCARGKLILARSLAEGHIPASRSVREILENCLVCLACVENCSSGVRVDKVVLAARRVLVHLRGQPLLKRLALRTMLPKPSLMRAAMKGGARLQPLAFRALPESCGQRRRFPLPGVGRDQVLPAIHSPSFLDIAGDSFPTPLSGTGGTAAYFCGCAANYLLPSIAESIMYVMRRLGFTVTVPPEQGCCGTPAEVNGERGVVEKLARRNITAFARGDAPIVTACGSGALMLGHEYPALFPTSDPMHGAAVQVAARVRDISVFLVATVGLASLERHIVRSPGKPVTYHDPCHLGRGCGVREEPRALLRSIAPDFREMNEADRCCGSGGTYGVSHWDTSKAIAERKLDNALKAGAEIIVTGCPACVLQLASSSERRSVGLIVAHSIELLAWCMGFAPTRGAGSALRFG